MKNNLNKKLKIFWSLLTDIHLKTLFKTKANRTRTRIKSREIDYDKAGLGKVKNDY